MIQLPSRLKAFLRIEMRRMLMIFSSDTSAENEENLDDKSQININ